MKLLALLKPLGLARLCERVVFDGVKLHQDRDSPLSRSFTFLHEYPAAYRFILFSVGHFFKPSDYVLGFVLDTAIQRPNLILLLFYFSTEIVTTVHDRVRSSSGENILVAMYPESACTLSIVIQTVSPVSSA